MAMESLEVEGIHFAATVASATSDKKLILGGAGYRSVEVAPGVNLKVTSIGIYFEDELLKELAYRWKGQSSSRLVENDEFFQDIISAQVEKCAKVALLKPLTGAQYSEKVIQHTKRELGRWDDDETEKAIGEFLDAFRDQNFLPGSAILLFVSPNGLTICFTHESDPDANIQAFSTIHNGRFAEAVLSTILGKQSVSPDAKASVARRVSSILSSTFQESAA